MPYSQAWRRTAVCQLPSPCLLLSSPSARREPFPPPGAGARRGRTGARPGDPTPQAAHARARPGAQRVGCGGGAAASDRIVELAAPASVDAASRSKTPTRSISPVRIAHHAHATGGSSRSSSSRHSAIVSAGVSSGSSSSRAPTIRHDAFRPGRPSHARFRLSCCCARLRRAAIDGTSGCVWYSATTALAWSISTLPGYTFDS
jgi:hypothetical protein